MYEVTHEEGPVPRARLADTRSGAVAEVAPTRGGMLTRLFARGAEILYLDEATLLNPSKNVRGGAPVLFPSPGKLTGDAWSLDGRHGAMKQHGFARNLPWEVVATDTSRRASVTLRLTSNDETRRAYPWDFAFELTYGLEGDRVTIEQRVQNRGDARMPFGVGFHPYFRVTQAEKADARIPIQATRAFDNVTKRDVAFSGFDLTAAEVDMHLVRYGAVGAELIVGGRTIELTCSPGFKRWVVWTLAGKDFVCLEPWTCPGDALNSGEDLLYVDPGQEQWLFTIITIKTRADA